MVIDDAAEALAGEAALALAVFSAALVAAAEALAEEAAEATLADADDTIAASCDGLAEDALRIWPAQFDKANPTTTMSASPMTASTMKRGSNCLTEGAPIGEGAGCEARRDADEWRDTSRAAAWRLSEG